MPYSVTILKHFLYKFRKSKIDLWVVLVLRPKAKYARVITSELPGFEQPGFDALSYYFPPHQLDGFYASSQRVLDKIKMQTISTLFYQKDVMRQIVYVFWRTLLIIIRQYMQE